MGFAEKPICPTDGGPAASHPTLVAQQTRPQVLDDLIMETNSSSIVSKRSVERLYFPHERHYFRYFVKKFSRRSPLINRGYWLRLTAIDVMVREFLSRPPDQKKVVVNLGCGSDVLPWQCHARCPAACENCLFVDVDYPALARRKAAVVLNTPQLRELLGTEGLRKAHPDDGPLVLQSEKYCQIGCDLRDLETLKETLSRLVKLSDCEFLFVAEVSITYMDTQSADALIEWASSVGQSEFCLLEQLLPYGRDHPFAQTMLSHFEKLRTPPRSVGEYPSLRSQKDRFHSRGWAQVDVWDLWAVWGGDRFVSAEERAALDEVEPFDEWEEFMLFARHYFVLHATATGEASPCRQTPDFARVENLEVEVTCYETQAPKRRFGHALATTNALGQSFAIHMMGMGTNGRSDNYDVHAIFHGSSSLQLPLSESPMARMCHTVTDLGDSGALLVGGRASPANAMSDCWILRKGVASCWERTWRLPTPLYRHAALRLRNSSLALVMGGKTGSVGVSAASFVFHPEKGWLRCVLSGDQPEPTFGAILCNSSDEQPEPDVFGGLLAGGLTRDGKINTRRYFWHLDVAVDPPNIHFRQVGTQVPQCDPLSVFGAQTVDMGTSTAVLGGMGEDAMVQGEVVTQVSVSEKEVQHRFSHLQRSQGQRVPFMIGSSALAHGRSIVILGGGATCFSMGTFWERGIYEIRLHKEDFPFTWRMPSMPAKAQIKFVRSIQATSSQIGSGASREVRDRPVVTQIPRVTLGAGRSFEDILRQRKPVIIERLELGESLRKWDRAYMVDKVAAHTQVVVHECSEGTEQMDFNLKNFRYVTDSFGRAMERMERGERLYLRSLSRAAPSEAPAMLERDFAGLAGDFALPGELDYVRQHLFSSVLRVSGRVNMWLHYDVMANVYAQVVGSKRMVLFPPDDVGQLSLAPGASSSSVHVFEQLGTVSLAKTHPHEAVLSAGDVLLVPPMWLHAATVMAETKMSVAVNVFFRDLPEAAYASGRDVYGNRDLAAYERGRSEARRVVNGFDGLPGEIRRFYVARIADEMVRDAERRGGIDE